MTADGAAVIRRTLSKTTIPAITGTVVDVLSHSGCILQLRDVTSGVGGSKHRPG
jgi:hypothetical protein